MSEILIVDDERVLREGMKKLLTGEGFAVRTARDGEEALVKIAERRPDLVLLDVMMPKANGFRVCEEIRKRDGLLPVVFLTAKDTEGDQVRALGLGADDFVPKGAPDAVLLARIDRAIARSRTIDRHVAEASGAEMRLGAVTVDFRTFSVLAGGNAIARLTKTEADILKLLDSQRGELVIQDDIITELRGNGFACEDTMLYMHISNLRKKLGPSADFIVNRRGVGYGII